MISCQLFGDDSIHDQRIQLPAIPRVGDRLIVPFCSNYTYRVTEVRFDANNPMVTLFLEWNSST